MLVIQRYSLDTSGYNESYLLVVRQGASALIEERLNELTPHVRSVKIVKSQSLSGEWLDFDHVFTYIEQGEAIFVLNGSSYRVSEGDAILMTPFVPHLIRPVSETPLLQYICHLDCRYTAERSSRTKLGSVCGESRYVPPDERLFIGLQPVVRIRINDRPLLRQTFVNMMKEHREERRAHTLLLRSGALTLLGLYLRNLDNDSAPSAAASNSWPVLEKCITVIQEHFTNPKLDNKMISAQAGISVSHMTHLFRHELGFSPHRYLTYVRIQQAKRLMLEENLSLTQVAEQSGFSGIHPFSRTFKSTTGVTATQYIASRKNLSIPNHTQQRREALYEQ